MRIHYVATRPAWLLKGSAGIAITMNLLLATSPLVARAQAQPAYKRSVPAQPSAAPVAAPVAGAPDESPGKSPSTAPLDPRAVLVKLNDGGVLKMTLMDEVIEIAGRYGTLRVAPADIRRIEFAARLPEATREQIDKAVPELDSREESVRAAAARQLVSLGCHAYPAVLKAAKNTDSLAGKEAAKILEKIRDSVDEKDLIPRATDVIHTGDSTITGMIVPSALRVHTGQFGELSLKIADVRSLRSQSLPEEEPEPQPSDALPDPGQLSRFHGQMGQTLRFRVTGAADGSLWGTRIYTTDSQLSTAAVHAGALKVGQTGIVSVRIVPGLPQYAGTVSNGVSSFGYGAYPVAFEFLKKKQ
jgi:LCCL domain